MSRKCIVALALLLAAGLAACEEKSQPSDEESEAEQTAESEPKKAVEVDEDAGTTTVNSPEGSVKVDKKKGTIELKLNE